MFRFKHFSISHDRSAMKVGVDGVLIGCWTDVAGAGTILDVGCGCGLISLIMAQRCPESHVVGIDIDFPSVNEARENVMSSPWKERVEIRNLSFPEDISLSCMNGFDLIVSNPPYFNSGIADASTRREKARHQGSLSPLSLIEYSKYLLNDKGSLAMIIPSDEYEIVEKEARSTGLTLVRKCHVRGHDKAPWKRVMLQWSHPEQKKLSACMEEYLTLEVSPGNPTETYRELCKDFYLKF